MSDEITVAPIAQVGNIKEVHAIKFIGDTSVVDKLLKTKCHDDIIYEHSEFAIVCELRRTSACLYRWLFEQTYLRNEKLSQYNPNTNMLIVRTSLSEVLQYIQKVTPPYLANTIESLNSIDDIVGALQLFLIDSKSDQFYQYYLNTFENSLRIGEFDTVWTYNDKKLIEKINTAYDPFVRVVDAYDESTKRTRMTYALSITPQHVDSIQKLLSVYKISNVYKRDDVITYVSLARI